MLWCVRGLQWRGWTVDEKLWTSLEGIIMIEWLTHSIIGSSSCAVLYCTILVVVDKLVDKNLLWCCLLHRETDISPFLTSISPVLSGQIEELELFNLSISSRGVGVLVHSLTSPHCRLHKLKLWNCTISSSDYCHLTTAIATSNLTHFICTHLSIDVAAGKALARALTQSKTLEKVDVWESPMYSEVARALVEAMNHSRVGMLGIGKNCEEAVSECSFPTDRVEFSWLTVSFCYNLFTFTWLLSSPCVSVHESCVTPVLYQCSLVFKSIPLLSSHMYYI